MNNKIKLIEQKFKTDIPNLYYTKKELEEHDLFMKKFVFPLDNLIKQGNFKSNGKEYNFFMLAYERLSDNVKLNLKDIYEEYRILYFKKKIENIINNNSFKQDKKSFNNYINGLNKLVGNEEVNKYLNGLK